MFGRSAGYEILAAIYFLTGTVAFAAAAIIQQIGTKPLIRQIVHESLRTNELLARMAPPGATQLSRDAQGVDGLGNSRAS